MTFKELADKVGIHIVDLVGDESEANYLVDEELYDCLLVENFVIDGTLSPDLQRVLV